ncbi:nitrogen-fixing NifU domain-containing protein [Candidatus Omnitrophus magneticus]|uniref:Nitrogen-fixing NifU domain-containing protein n=1 Tax=Candidatus Omnitrophus magneticus TaxID=1609969 RepID=A0A0F0CNL5_9BACT|nr:nitrogen-fixing NifU domain-containing protein [Candidatus Omnitrophus magneticus]
MEDRIKKAIDTIRPILNRDGGDIEFVSLDKDIVKVRLRGACSGCPMSQMTVKSVVERIIKEHVPEVKSVVTV